MSDLDLMNPPDGFMGILSRLIEYVEEERDRAYRLGITHGMTRARALAQSQDEALRTSSEQEPAGGK